MLEGGPGPLPELSRIRAPAIDQAARNLGIVTHRGRFWRAQKGDPLG